MKEWLIFGVSPGENDETCLGVTTADTASDAITRYATEIHAALLAEAEDEVGEDVDPAEISVPRISHAEELTADVRAECAAIAESYRAMGTAIGAACDQRRRTWTGAVGDGAGYLTDD